ncbi:hypothetical protein BaRGS_00026445 [Batillaria attramentaria]|uniref:Uncharacterized protein n=1 Tax=Batillaria attramentaria TaxID=370345 RepID=A0ABD0K4F3_9CAEN
MPLLSSKTTSSHSPLLTNRTPNKTTQLRHQDALCIKEDLRSKTTSSHSPLLTNRTPNKTTQLRHQDALCFKEDLRYICRCVPSIPTMIKLALRVLRCTKPRGLSLSEVF